MRPPLNVDWVIAVDRFEQTPDGKMNLYGVAAGVYAKSFPVTFDGVTLVLKVSGKPGAQHTIQILLEAREGSPALPPGRIQLNHHGEAIISVKIPQTPIVAPGIHRFGVAVDGRLVSHFDFPFDLLTQH